MLLVCVDYQLPYEEYVQRNETNENRILDVLHRVIVGEHKRPILHRTNTMNSVRFSFSFPRFFPKLLLT